MRTMIILVSLEIIQNIDKPQNQYVEVAIPTVVSFSSFFRLLHYSTLSHVA